MALIQHGSFDDFSARIAEPTRSQFRGLDDITTFAAAREATRAVQPAGMGYDVSNDKRGLALKSLKLTKGFEGFLGNLFDSTNEVYFLAWSWDFSGKGVEVYPSADNPQSCIIPLNVGDNVRFIESGIVIFHAREITAGLATRIMLWESDKDDRDLGETLRAVAKAVDESNLNSSLRSYVPTTPTTEIIDKVKNAAIELVDLIGGILKNNSDDYVDYYEGYFEASKPWPKNDLRYCSNASEIVLTPLT